jgi:hypothetical protein
VKCGLEEALKGLLGVIAEWTEATSNEKVVGVLSYLVDIVQAMVATDEGSEGGHYRAHIGAEPLKLFLVSR